MPTRFDDGVDKQVEDLRERMRLLQQDRRANIDLLEANKQANEIEIRSLKEDNKKLRIRLSNLQKSAVSDADSHLSDVDSLRRLVRQKRNEFDTQKSSSKKLNSKLNKLKSEAVMEDNRPSPEDVELSRQIRKLENRLDKAMMQYNEAQGICSTYEHIVKRLKSERIEFDNQLTALERTLESKYRDFEELTLLCGDASHARDVAQHTLNKAKWSFEENKQRRSRELRERQQHIKVRKQIIKKQERAEEDKRRQQLRSADTDGTYVGEMSTSNNSISVSPQEQIADQEQKLSVYENAFRKIKDATGVGTVNEMIRKVIGQESTTKNLVSLSAQHQTKVEGLSRLQKSLVNDVQVVKCSLSVSSSSTKKSTKPLDELQDTLYARSSQLERAKSQLDRLELAIVSTKAGVEHLRAKLVDLPDEFDVDSSGNLLEMSLPDIIRSSGDILLDVHDRANDNTADEFNNKHSTKESNNTSSNSNKVTRFSPQIETESNLQSRRPTTRGAAEVSVPFNQRITLRSAKERAAFDQDDSDDDGADFGDLGMDTISRKTLKKMSYHIVAAEERKRLLQQQQAALVENG